MRAMLLAGRSVVVTREAERAGPLVEALAEAGATTIEIPALRTDPPADEGRALAAALAAGDRYDWLLFTSAAAVRAVGAAVAGPPVGGRTRIGVVGEATASAARRTGMDVSLTAPADDASAAGLARALLAVESQPQRALVPASDIARPDLSDALSAAGWTVDGVEAYRTVRLAVADADAARAADADAIVFYSPSAVDAWDGRLLPPVVVTIGPTSSAAVRARGAVVAAEAAERSAAGVVAALADAFSA